MMLPRDWLGVAFLSIALCTACTAETPEDSQAAGEAISTSPAIARARQVRDAYLAADISAFKPSKLAALPSEARLVSQTEARPSSSAGCSPDVNTLDVHGFGKVFVVEERGDCSALAPIIFFDAAGSAVCAAIIFPGPKGRTLSFFLPTVSQGRITLLQTI